MMNNTFLLSMDYWLIEPQKMAMVLLSDSMEKVAQLLAANMEPVTLAEKRPGLAGKSVAIVHVSGVMMKQPSWMGGTSTLQVRKELQAAAADPDVGAVLLSIDSPGGSVAGMSELAASTKDAAARKPVWAQIHDVGGSAAYWLASQADRVIANNDLTRVGSIGVYYPLYDESAAAAMQGVKVDNITTGPIKGIGVPGTPITDAHRAYVQKMVDYVHGRFVDTVQKARGLSKQQMDAVTHGGTLPAPEALSAGLIDGIQPIETTLAQLGAGVKPGRPRAEDHVESGAGRSGAVLPMARQTLPMRRV